jgi:Uncharacterised nucleotidyltransferase
MQHDLMSRDRFTTCWESLVSPWSTSQVNATLASPPSPTALQLQLLRVALLEPEVAVATWRRLRPEFVLDDVWDRETYQLLPLVYRKLATLEIDEPVLPRLKGLHRREWYQNQVRLSRLADLLRQLERASVDTMVLGGVPLVVRYYGDIGARPIGRLDVLVPSSRRADASKVVLANAWTHVDTGGAVVDLQAHLAEPFRLPGNDRESEDDFWRGAEPIEVAGARTRTLCASDQLMHVIVDGLVTRNEASVLWMADAFVVLSDVRGVEWDRFVQQAESRRLALLMDVALGYLTDALDAPIPAEIRRRLSRAPLTRRDVHAVERSLARERHGSGLRGLFVLGPAWAWRRAKLGPVTAPLHLPRFLQDTWQLPRRSRVPIEAVRRFGHRLRNMRRRRTARCGDLAR